MDLTKKLKERFSILPHLFDDIRIVDPLSKQIISVDDETGVISVHKSKCFHAFSKCSVCENCVSYRSFIKNDTFVKIERAGKDKFIRFISTPIKVGGMNYIVEILKEVDYNAAGIEDIELNLNINNMIEDMNRKIVTDELTGVYNRRFIQERLDVDIYNQRKNKKSYTMVMADIDYFKHINDQYGHLAGDIVLQETSKLIKNNIDNQFGWIGRYGGEEFIFIYYNKSLLDVVKSVEDIRASLAKKEFIYNTEKINVTASFGIVELRDEYKTGNDFLESADKMLYKAKKNGRNRVEYKV